MWRTLLPAALVVTALNGACGPKEGEGPPVGVSSKAGAPLEKVDKETVFTFDSLDERPVSSESMRGKPAVIVFVTTGDIVGQAQVSYLVHMAKNDGDRVFYAMVAVHPRKEAILVETYKQTLGVDFPVALADAAVASDKGPFGEIPAVPTVVILDRFGRMVWKHTGLAKNEELRGHMHGL
ncbi:MAG: TlpA disulfide reductase family protein [Labilithrix sp.]